MRIAFLFYEGMTALDAVGPHEILSRLPGAEVFRTAKIAEPKIAEPVYTDSGLILVADHPLSAITHADILLIPGAGSAATLRNQPEILEGCDLSIELQLGQLLSVQEA